MNESTGLEKLITTQDLARRYKVTTRTIQNWRDLGMIPTIRINQRVFRYDLEKVQAALETNGGKA